MTDILEELELRQVNTLDLPKDKRQWPITVTAGELDALIRVARTAEVLFDRSGVQTVGMSSKLNALEEALQQLRDLEETYETHSTSSQGATAQDDE